MLPGRGAYHFRRHYRGAVMCLERVEVYRDQNDIALVRRPLRITENLIAVSFEEPKILKILQRDILASNLIHPSDELADVAGLMPIANLDLIFFRIQILLGPRYRFIFAKLIAAIDSVR